MGTESPRLVLASGTRLPTRHCQQPTTPSSNTLAQEEHMYRANIKAMVPNDKQQTVPARKPRPDTPLVL